MRQFKLAIFMTLVLFACHGGASAQMLYDTSPSVAVSTDKSTYERFEPIIVTLHVTNTSDRRQEYGPVGLLPTWPNSIYLKVLAPDSTEMIEYDLYPRSEFPSNQTYTFEPSETRSDTFNLLMAYPVFQDTGAFRVVVDFADQASGMWTSIAETGFDVVNPTGIDADLLDLIAKATRETLDLLPWSNLFSQIPDHEMLLDSLWHLPGLPTHVAEFTQFVHGLFAELDWSWGNRDSTDYIQRFADFQSDYPLSVYNKVVNQRLLDLEYYGGGTDYTKFADVLTYVKGKVFLQGALDVSSLSLDLSVHNVIPRESPYSEEPWQTNGVFFDDNPADDVVDWVLVTLVDTTSPEQPIVARIPAQLPSNGEFTARFVNIQRGNYAVVVDHRNHVAIMSDSLLDLNLGVVRHDFTTGHALAGVPNPQKQIVSGQDTVYAMWAGDANGDGLVAAADFDAWLQSTTAGETGYRPTDFNMDRQVTALDFTKWIANTTAHAETGISDSLYNVLYPSDGGGVGLTIQSELTGPQCYVRLNVTRDTGNDYWVNVEAKTDVAEKTLASMTIDVFYDSSEVALGSTEPGVLQDGYQVAISERVRESGHFVRVDVRAAGIPTQSLGHDLGTDWEVVRKLYFSRTPPKRDAGTSIRARSLAIDFFTVHWNAGGHNGTVSSPVEIQ